MGRHPQPAISTQLLERCTDHALQHGLPDRLEPFVRATGSSARMLLYHFGTRDALLLAVLRRARERQLADWGELLRLRPDEPYTTTLGRAWVAMSGPDGAGYLRVFSALREHAEQSLWPGFRRLATTDWLEPLATGLSSLGRPDAATLALAVIRGLFLDVEATGDLDRADAAFTALLRALDPDAPAVPTRSG